MNALHVIVSLHILMVLARLNHAHGLSTYGIKTSNQAPVEGTHCSSQSNCVIKGTTCIGSYCLCGDNNHPDNGVCRNTLKGPKHICEDDNECVAGADCVESKEPSSSSAYKTCQCQEGLTATRTGTCSGVSSFVVFPSLLIISAILVKIY